MTLQELAVVGGLLALAWPVIMGALLWMMGRYFASQKEMNGLGDRVTKEVNGLGDRVTGIQKVSEVATERADAAAHSAEITEHKLEDERRFAEERYLQILKAQETISVTNQRTAETLQAIQLAQERSAGVTSKLAADLERLTKTVDNLVDKLLAALDRRSATL